MTMISMISFLINVCSKNTNNIFTLPCLDYACPHFVYMLLSHYCIHSGNKTERIWIRKYSKVGQPKDEEEGLDEVDEEEHGDTLCGACGENYASDEFWICCDICEKWFHGSVWRSPLRGLSTSNSTSAPHAATREQCLDISHLRWANSRLL